MPFHLRGKNRGVHLRAGRIGFLSAGLSLLVCLGAVSLGAAQAAEAPRTINDCEKIQAADAYNQCLASFGPVAHEHGAKVDPEGTSKLKDSDFKDAPPASAATPGAAPVANAPAAEVAPDEKDKGARKSRRASRGHASRHYSTRGYSHHASGGRKSIQFDIH